MGPQPPSPLSAASGSRASRGVPEGAAGTARRSAQLGVVVACRPAQFHRDLKPANIIMSEDGPRVIDFGVARAVQGTRLTTEAGGVIGTAGFLAPEQATGGDISPMTDVFAFGAVLAHAAGALPFGRADAVTLMYRAVHHEPDLTAVPAELRPMIASCLAKNPSHRPTPGQLLTTLSVNGTATAAPSGPSGTAIATVDSSEPHTAADPTPAPARERRARARGRPRQPAGKAAASTPDGGAPEAVAFTVSTRASCLPPLGYLLLLGLSVFNLNSSYSDGSRGGGAKALAWVMLLIPLILPYTQISEEPILMADGRALAISVPSSTPTRIPWDGVVSISLHAEKPPDRQRVLVTLHSSAPVPVARNGIKIISCTQIALPLPGGRRSPWPTAAANSSP
ncbi:protein kinase [Streptomyces uncialis]|uniref:protein kinase domain-containing protein n=1 Tax=Streptomyces uncialis TaxID=1048205 RepID=UPI003811739A